MFRGVKKGFMLSFSIIIFALVLSACATADKTGSQGKETFNLKMNVVFPKATSEAEPKAAVTEKFARLVKERTNGRVTIDVFYSNQLVPTDQALDALANGTIDIESAGSYWGDKVPTQDFAWLPFAFYGPDYMKHVLRETKIGEIYERNLKKMGVKVLSYWPSGTEGIISTQPVKKLEDMKGMTFRLGSGLWTDWYKEIGVAPANIAGPEQYQALMRGTIDGAMYPFYAVETHKLHEVADHITVPGIIDPILCVNYISLKTWNQLPEDLQNTIEEVALQVENEAFEASKKITQHALNMAKENGVTIHRLTEEEYRKFEESSQIVWEQFAAQNEDTKRIIEILKKDRKEYLKNNPQAEEWKEKWLAD